MAKISPSILAADFANLERDILDIEANGADFVHVDIMDPLMALNLQLWIFHFLFALSFPVMRASWWLRW